MSRTKLYSINAKVVRDKLNEAIELADKIIEHEKCLVIVLSYIDKNRFFVRYGFKSLSGFCTKALGSDRIKLS